MPSLNVIFTGNAGPLNAVMTAQAGKMKAFQKAIAQSSLSPEAKQAAYAKLALDEEINRKIANVTPERSAIRKRRMAQEMAELAGGSGGFSWVKKAGVEAMEDIGGGAAKAGRHVGGLNLILRESLVVLREIGRGNWSRVPGSLSLIVQGFAQLKGLSLLRLGIIGGALATSALLIYERFFNLKNLIKELSFDVSKVDIGSTYIPLMKRHINDAANAQRELNDAIRKTVESYNSAAEAAKRVSDITKEHFDHQRRMNDLSNAPDSVKNQRALEIDQAERAQAIANKESEMTELKAESERKATEAREKYGGLSTKEEDEDTQKKLEARAQAADEFLKGGGFWDEFQKRAASIAGLDSGVVAQLNSAGESGSDLANKWIKESDKFKDKTAKNDVKRGLQKELTDAANKSAAAAAGIELNLPLLRAQAAQKNQDEADEMRARNLQSNVKGELSANQQIGAFAFQANTQIDLQRQSLSVEKQSMDYLKAIATKGGVEKQSMDYLKAIATNSGGVPGYGGN